MAQINIDIPRDDVYEEIAKTTAYTGRKIGEEGAYERILSTDEDQAEMFQRFWDEACAALTDKVKPFIDTGATFSTVAGYVVTLTMPSNYDPKMNQSVIDDMWSFLSLSIAAKWFALSNPASVPGTETAARQAMEDMLRKLYYRKRPTRDVSLRPNRPRNI